MEMKFILWNKLNICEAQHSVCFMYIDEYPCIKLSDPFPFQDKTLLFVLRLTVTTTVNCTTKQTKWQIEYRVALKLTTITSKSLSKCIIKISVYYALVH